MKKKSKIKNSFDGIVIIGVIAVIESISALMVYFHTRNWPAPTNPLPTFIYDGGMLAGCYLAYKVAQKYSFPLINFFRDFNFSKGIAVFYLWQALMFWPALFHNYHNTLGYYEPFGFPIFFQTVIIFGLGIALLSLRIAYAFSKTAKPVKKEMKQNLFKVAVENMLFLKFFFKQLWSDKIGKALAIIFGSAYMAVLAIRIITILITPSNYVSTSGYITNINEVAVVNGGRWARKTINDLYIIKLDSKPEAQFTVKNLPDSCHINSKALISHSPLDYNISFIQVVRADPEITCEEN